MARAGGPPQVPALNERISRRRATRSRLMPGYASLCRTPVIIRRTAGSGRSGPTPALQLRARADWDRLDTKYSPMASRRQLATGCIPDVQMGTTRGRLHHAVCRMDDPRSFFDDTMILHWHVRRCELDVPPREGCRLVLTCPAKPDPRIRVPLGKPPASEKFSTRNSEPRRWRRRAGACERFRGPRRSEQEQRVRHFHRELDRYINREK